MVERIAFFSKGDDVVLMFRNDAANGDVRDGVAEFFYNTADQTVFGVVMKYSKLSLATVGTADVVRIHASNEVVFALSDTKVQGLAQAAVFRQTADVQARSKLLLHAGNDGVQFRRQGSITDEDKVVGRDGLVVNALHALP